MHTQARLDALQRNQGLHTYRIEQVLGSGTFGITYLVQHEMLHTWHVIKEYMPDNALREHRSGTVRPKSDGDRELFDWGMKSFYDEARLLHKLNHTNIVKVTDLFTANGTAYFVMPFLRGITLHQWIAQHPRPTQEELEATGWGKRK